MTTARDIAHRYARKAHLCAYNKHSDKHQEHSEFCDALATDIEHHASGLVNLMIENYRNHPMMMLDSDGKVIAVEFPPTVEPRR